MSTRIQPAHVVNPPMMPLTWHCCECSDGAGGVSTETSPEQELAPYKLVVSVNKLLRTSIGMSHEEIEEQTPIRTSQTYGRDDHASLQ